MATASRLAPSRKGKLKPAIKLPVSHDDWHKLMLGALNAATAAQHPLENGLRAALANGQSEQYLRKHGIICPADIQRKFPVK